MRYRVRNQKAWDRLVAQGSQFARTATDAECSNPLAALDGRGWLPHTVAGLRVLCLAAGGGWQSILYASAGAQVTVVDISPGMLELDSSEASRRNLNLRLIEGSMDDLSMLEDDSFDIVHQPVSTCYVPDILPVYREIGRVLRPGGTYLSQHKQPASLQITRMNSRKLYELGIEYYHKGPLPPVQDEAYREEQAEEYLHRWEDLLGGLCRSGFVVEDVVEPVRADPTAPAGHYRHRGRFVAPFVRILARRREGIVAPASQSSSLWIP